MAQRKTGVLQERAIGGGSRGPGKLSHRPQAGLRRLNHLNTRNRSPALTLKRAWSHSHSVQRNQLPAAPDRKRNDQKDKETEGEQLATRMRGRREVNIIVGKVKIAFRFARDLRFARRVNGRMQCSSSAKSNVGHAFLQGISHI